MTGNCAQYTEYIQAVYEDKVWPNHMKPGVLAWAIAEQGERRHEVNGMGELARNADNYHSLHQRKDMKQWYPRTYHLLSTDEEDNNYIDFDSPAQELEGLYRFIHRPYYGDVDSHMGSFEELLRFICPPFCPRRDYVEWVLSFLPEAEAELRKIGWKPEETTLINDVSNMTNEYNVQNHLLCFGKNPVPYFASPNKDKWAKNVPTSIILHYTASLGVSGITNWFQNPRSGVSPHLLISSTGTVIQFVPFYQPAWHSGTAKHNRSSIGIELEGLGCSRIRVINKVAFNVWGGPKFVNEADCIYAAHRLEPKIYRWWPKFTDAQYDAMNMVIPVLRKAYGGLVLLGHEHVCAGKLDPGCAFERNRVT